MIPTIKKMPPHNGHRTTYVVKLSRQVIGYVWSIRGFSYRGVQGWNRGVRIRDYHPIEWYYGFKLESYTGSHSAYNRRLAVEALVRMHKGMNRANP